MWIIIILIKVIKLYLKQDYILQRAVSRRYRTCMPKIVGWVPAKNEIYPKVADTLRGWVS